MEIRALREGDDRRKFSSGDPDLDRFFQLFAGQSQFKHHVGVTYVVVTDQIVGYATVSPCHIDIDDLPTAVRKKLPHYPIPALRLARLAIDRTARGQGLGASLLRFVLHLSVRMTDDFGCAGVVVDAKTDAIAFYAKYGFEPLSAVAGGSSSRPAPTPMFLTMRAIKAALAR